MTLTPLARQSAAASFASKSTDSYGLPLATGLGTVHISIFSTLHESVQGLYQDNGPLLHKGCVDNLVCFAYTLKENFPPPRYFVCSDRSQ